MFFIISFICLLYVSKAKSELLKRNEKFSLKSDTLSSSLESIFERKYLSGLVETRQDEGLSSCGITKNHIRIFSFFLITIVYFPIGKQSI